MDMPDIQSNLRYKVQVKAKQYEGGGHRFNPGRRLQVELNKFVLCRDTQAVNGSRL